MHKIYYFLFVYRTEYALHSRPIRFIFYHSFSLFNLVVLFRVHRLWLLVQFYQICLVYSFVFFLNPSEKSVKSYFQALRIFTYGIRTVVIFLIIIFFYAFLLIKKSYNVTAWKPILNILLLWIGAFLEHKYGIKGRNIQIVHFFDVEKLTLNWKMLIQRHSLCFAGFRFFSVCHYHNVCAMV